MMLMCKQVKTPLKELHLFIFIDKKKHESNSSFKRHNIVDI